jgi:septal ring factor EnvC (AmiA/AmiB activator)
MMQQQTGTAAVWLKMQQAAVLQVAFVLKLLIYCVILHMRCHVPHQVASVQQELLQLRHDAAAASRERRQLQQHASELEAQRSSTGAAMLQLHQQLADVQEQLAQDRATMATMLRQHQQQKQQLEEVSMH